MRYHLLSLLFLQPLWLSVLISVHRILPMKHPVSYCGLSILTMDLLWILNQVILPFPLDLLYLCILFSGFCYLPFFASGGQKLLSLFVFAILISLTLVLTNLLSMTLMGLSPLLGVTAGRFRDPGDFLYSLQVIVVDCCLLPALWGLSNLMIRHRGAFFESRLLLYFMSIPCSQAALLAMLTENIGALNQIHGWILILTAALLCIGADFASILGYRKILELQLIADQVQQAEQQLRTQNEYYGEMQESILKVNRIRHDLNNQLKTAYYLLEQGHSEEVRAQLDTLKSCIQDHVGTRYCENLMVDAVLREKAARCRQLEIPLELHVLVPADLNIESAHLCSAFSNLLDNCIAAAQKAGPGSGPIRLRSDVHKGYLTISCSNPSVPPRQETRQDILRRHGLGLEILGRLSKLHSGSFETDFRDGRFYVSLILKNL